jgi:hypothetical protein
LSLLLCAVECSGDQQNLWPSDAAHYWKAFEELIALEGSFQAVNLSLFLYYK